MILNQLSGSAYEPINRELHEYLAITCRHHYRVLVELTEGSQFAALALMIRTNQHCEEFLCLGFAEAVREIRLDRIQAITPLELSAIFTRLVLSPDDTALLNTEYAEYRIEARKEGG
ncbi:Rho-binding antiterminator [Pseudomonas sp. T8]|uniref:Rho-binding antiterminator n=1 Tax=Pseudomonas sp. T8 TaxID=645292 RepID=UPI002148BAD9|nr:Rho-binding antiterminator [Pseudomonas sp. T8]UUT22931.1 Rho-binding antiterminator [Pseudomonas sp. T8]